MSRTDRHLNSLNRLVKRKIQVYYPLNQVILLCQCQRVNNESDNNKIDKQFVQLLSKDWLCGFSFLILHLQVKQIMTCQAASMRRGSQNQLREPAGDGLYQFLQLLVLDWSGLMVESKEGRDIPLIKEAPSDTLRRWIAKIKPDKN